MRKSVLVGHLIGVCLLVAATAWGQAGTNSGVIAGEISDSSGAKISGATVEIASPALIERVRDTTTGDDGLYKIVNVPPGIYMVTATQNGFNKVVREGIEITTGFTATVNFAMTPGSVEQTVTVTGEAPVLDTQDSVVQKVISNAVLESLPVGQSAAAFPSLVPGAIASAANQDVGGLKGEQAQGFRIHGSGSGDYMLLHDGMAFNNGANGNQSATMNPTATQEMQLEVGGYSAEDWTAGGHVNVIPRSGGNDLHGSALFDFGDHALQGNNVTPAIAGLGVPQPGSIKSLYEIAGGVGGPIKKDKLWFFADARRWVSSQYYGGSTFFYNANEAAPFPNFLYYAADANRRAYDLNEYLTLGLRLTWQATKRNQFSLTVGQDKDCNCVYTLSNGTLSPEASTNHWYLPNYKIQSTWTFPVNDKLLLWAGFTGQSLSVDKDNSGSNPANFAIADSSAGYTYGASGTGVGLTAAYGHIDQLEYNENFTASYVTGPHAFKVGFTEGQGRLGNFATFSNASGANGYPNGSELSMACTAISTTSAIDPANGLPEGPYSTVNSSGVVSSPLASAVGPGTGQIAPSTVNSLQCSPVAVKGSLTCTSCTINGSGSTATTTVPQALLPTSISEFLAPYNYTGRNEKRAIFAQDQWKIRRLTLNLGLRFDWFSSGNLPFTEPAVPQYGLPAKSIAGESNTVDWKDLNPRLGAAYDLFGNGKTAIKASLARSVQLEPLLNMTTLTNPASLLLTSTSRTFTDTAGTLSPVGNFTTFTQNGELGAASSGFYSQSTNTSIAYSPSVTQGWQNRPYDWQLSASIQQEILPGFALSFGYYRTWFGNLTVAKNGLPAGAAGLADYDQYCVNVPASTAYPGIGGSPICNLYDPISTPAIATAANTYTVDQASQFGKESDVYTGIDVLANARFHGLVLQGGVSAGHEVTNYCVEVNSPQDLSYIPNAAPGASIVEFANNNSGGTNDAAPCFIDPPWYQNLQFKMAVVYTVPKVGIKLSANEQNLPSIPLTASYSYKAANVVFPCALPTPGTCNSANHDGANPVLNDTQSLKVEAVTPQTVFPFGRNNQLDFRVARVFTLRERWKIEPTVDFYNVLNASTILTIATAYNTTAAGNTGAWRNVTGLLPARMVKFGVHFDF